MAFTYNIDTDRGKVRLAIGDTDSTDQQLQDGEIDYYLSIANNAIYPAASLAARGLQAKYSRKANTTIESVSINYSDLAKHYASLAIQLERDGAKAISPANTVIISGINIDLMNDVDDDEQRVQGYVETGQFDNPPLRQRNRTNYYD